LVNAAGWRILHHVSVHKAAMAKSHATATADHQLEPHGTRFFQ